ncbi:MAG: kinase-like domain-containing protein [Linnemannia elongata]|nr:MAG: kinase-like domain-containing protein [Linnemannia elongata]
MGAGCCKEEAIDFTSEIELSHFHLLRSVGKGAFGKVRVVQHKKTKEIYALKYINKAKCIRMRAVENIIQERRLLEEVEFSLICNLRYAFQDDENLFMVLDLMLGGDLRFHLERAGPMKEEVVRFYVAELALALDALHSRRIIHRDLKPDNVLLDEHGHAHLTDFNIAVYYNPTKPLVSIAGSMAYMAPEVLLRKGYFESVDWWSLGVVMFELLFGRRPFRGKSNDLLTNSILRDPLPFPENVDDIVSAPCLDVLSKLCERDISKRLGCTSEGLDAFKQHPWFQGIEWDKLVTKEATPPFEPDSKRANFDATHELEELLMEDNPLKAKKRAQTSPEVELSSEMQLMEDKFIIYDFSKVKRPSARSHPATDGP